MKTLTFFLALMSFIALAFAGAIPQHDIALAGDVTPNVRYPAPARNLSPKLKACSLARHGDTLREVLPDLQALQGGKIATSRSLIAHTKLNQNICLIKGCDEYCKDLACWSIVNGQTCSALCLWYCKKE